MGKIYFDAKIPLDKLQLVFGMPPYDPMVDCYEIERSHLAFLNVYTDHHFELEKYAYFLESEAESPSIPIRVKDGEVVGLDSATGGEKDVEYVLKLE